MAFRQGAYAHIWQLENKGKYHVARMSTSRKNKETDQYETDWTDSFVRLIGQAHEQADKIDISKNVRIGSCEVTNKYDKETGKTYTNYAIFGFENAQDSAVKKQNKPNADEFMKIPEDSDDDGLPFN